MDRNEAIIYEWEPRDGHDSKIIELHAHDERHHEFNWDRVLEVLGPDGRRIVSVSRYY